MTRPDWNEFYLGIAEAASKRGDCTRSQVGAVIVKFLPSGKHLTSLGYNGVESGKPGCLDGECPRGRLSYDELPPLSSYSSGMGKCISTHAEVNAAINATFDLRLSRVYVTRQPCDDCIDYLWNKGCFEFIWPGGFFYAQSQKDLHLP